TTNDVGGSSATITSTATVGDAPLLGSAGNVAMPTNFSGVGTANVTSAISSFQTAIGGANNGGNPPPQTTGFRAINWDGVKVDGTDFGGNTTVIVPGHTVGIPFNRFQARGLLLGDIY